MCSHQLLSLSGNGVQSRSITTVLSFRQGFGRRNAHMDESDVTELDPFVCGIVASMFQHKPAFHACPIRRALSAHDAYAHRHGWKKRHGDPAVPIRHGEWPQLFTIQPYQPFFLVLSFAYFCRFPYALSLSLLLVTDPSLNYFHFTGPEGVGHLLPKRTETGE